MLTPLPPSGREGDRGSGGRRMRLNFYVLFRTSFGRIVIVCGFLQTISKTVLIENLNEPTAFYNIYCGTIAFSSATSRQTGLVLSVFPSKNLFVISKRKAILPSSNLIKTTELIL